MSLNLTPTTVAAADISTAQSPALGGELQVYLTSKTSKLLGKATLTANGQAGLSWKYVGLPAYAGTNPIVAVATGGGIFQTAADTITFAGRAGSFTPAGWSSITGFDFPVGRAVELDGTYSAPNASSVPQLSLGAGSGMLNGSQFEIWELPLLADFNLAGCTTDRQLTIPARGTKNIPCGMNEAEWTVPGMTKVGQLEVTGLNQGYDDGLLRYAGVKCQAMLVEMRDSRLVRLRAICTDWIGDCKAPYPSGDSEATVTLSGQFSRFIALVPQ
jgi:hypothetical protein